MMLWIILAGTVLVAALLLRREFHGGAGAELSGKMEQILRDEAERERGELARELRATREELLHTMQLFSEGQRSEWTRYLENDRETQKQQEQRFADFRREVASSLERVREELEKRLKELQEGNAAKLEEMRKTVDEKLRESVEKRFNESFKLISERLEQVHKGLGEMHTLAGGVGDLKRVLTNVKTRGVLGEIQLGALLSECLAPEQYECNAAVKRGSSERVEFAIRLPGREDGGSPVLLPIDSKFPTEDYQRLLDAYDAGNELDPALRAFESAVRKNARTIREKYINPPVTTDFAVMFVPTEGLYSEILRRPGLFESLTRDERISVVGPSNLVAFLGSLQMGFRTLAIEKRSAEVWTLLAAVKTEFGKFGDVLEKTHTKLMQAASAIDQAHVRTRAIDRKLRKIQELPANEAQSLLEDVGEAAATPAEEGDSDVSADNS